jgi:hypothetical protein
MKDTIVIYQFKDPYDSDDIEVDVAPVVCDECGEELDKCYCIKNYKPLNDQ